jgi:pimeloyl-ACP methyl ester carboxylesterase
MMNQHRLVTGVTGLIALAAGLNLIAFGNDTAIAAPTPRNNTMTPDPTAVRPFKAHVSQAELDDLKKRLAQTRFPDRETVTDKTQGVQLATMKKLVHHWQAEYDWRKAEARLNALPQYTTTIDGLDIHFIWVRSRVPNAMPLIMTHGWPGSVFELLGVIDPLTNPSAHGGRAEDAFDIVLPSLPGYGFSGKPTTTGWNPDRVARAWDTLMKRLGYKRYVAQGGDWGARIAEAMARQAPEGLQAIHTNLLLSVPPEVLKGIASGDPPPASFSDDEKTAWAQRKTLQLGYFIEQASHPQTIGYSLADSPAGLAAWLLDHDPQSYQQMVDAFDGKPQGGITRDAILDDLTLYWLTNTGTSAAQLYWENARVKYAGPVNVPAGFTVFAREIWQAPRSWVERTFPNLIYFNKVDNAGHFAAWEQPELFATEVRAAFRSLR